MPEAGHMPAFFVGSDVIAFLTSGERHANLGMRILERPTKRIFWQWVMTSGNVV